LGYWKPFEALAADVTRAERIRLALDATEVVFKRLQALRVHLAKHEVPRVRGSRAMAPGYGEIDSLTGSIAWQVNLTEYEVDLVSRQRISDECLTLSEDRSRYILPSEVQEMVRVLPKQSYGMKRVIVTLRDGTEHPYVFRCGEPRGATLRREGDSCRSGSLGDDPPESCRNRSHRVSKGGIPARSGKGPLSRVEPRDASDSGAFSVELVTPVLPLRWS
jgi:hypothetical protein